MVDSTDYSRHAVASIETLTGLSLLALARLERLSVLTLGPARFTGTSIFQYFCRVSKAEDSIGTCRTISLTVAGYGPVGMPAFYAELPELLALLSEVSEAALGAATCRQQPVLHLRNPYLSSASPIWSDGYLSEGLRPAVAAVKQAHPSLGVAVHIHGRDGDEFTRIQELALDWRRPHTQVFFDGVGRR
jgi:hypothetical protein